MVETKNPMIIVMTMKTKRIKSHNLFMLEQLEVLLEMNRPNFVRLVETLKRGSSKRVSFKQVLSLGILMGSEIKKLYMFSLQRWNITFMLPKVGEGDILSWNLLIPI